MKEKIGYTEELQSNGQIAKSIMRWGFGFMIVFASVVTGYMVVTKTTDLGLIALLYGYAFTGKIGQKYIENQKTPEVKNENPT